jgi:hypothetical protein
LSWAFPAPADFNDAAIVAPTVLALGEADFATAAADLASRDLAGGLDTAFQGVDCVDVLTPELRIIGTAVGVEPLCAELLARRAPAATRGGRTRGDRTSAEDNLSQPTVPLSRS